MTRRVAVVVGTRPEAIKLAPVITALQDEPGVDVRTIASAQHRELLDQTLALFDLRADVDLDLMEADQQLAAFVARAIEGVSTALAALAPDFVVVQGDTNTAMAAALAAFYLGIPVAHVEAGLRSRDRRRPFPEEINRRLVSTLADLHFAPTPAARDNLLAEGVADQDIVVTGNTIVDALESIDVRGTYDDPSLAFLHGNDVPLILLTAHRRESFGPPLQRICRAVQRIVRGHDVEVVYPVHPNPNVREVVHDALGGEPKVHLVAPVSYRDLLRLLDRAVLALTDSGGIQEEAPSFDTPVVVLRDVTERPEVVDAGAGLLVGTGEDAIVDAVTALLDDAPRRAAMAAVPNPFGDGKAARRIVDALRTRLGA